MATIPKEEFSKEECNKEMKILHNKLFELQNVFYADGRFSMLVVFRHWIRLEKTVPSGM